MIRQGPLAVNMERLPVHANTYFTKATLPAASSRGRPARRVFSRGRAWPFRTFMRPRTTPFGWRRTSPPLPDASTVIPHRLCGTHQDIGAMVIPPSVRTIAPLTYEDSSQARRSATLAILSGLPKRRRGARAKKVFGVKTGGVVRIALLEHFGFDAGRTDAIDAHLPAGRIPPPSTGSATWRRPCWPIGVATGDTHDAGAGTVLITEPPPLARIRGMPYLQHRKRGRYISICN